MYTRIMRVSPSKPSSAADVAAAPGDSKEFELMMLTGNDPPGYVILCMHVIRGITHLRSCRLPIMRIFGGRVRGG